MQTRVNKRIKDIDTALTIYYSYPEIGNKEMIDLFGDMASSTIAKMKKMAKERMIEEDVNSCMQFTVNTKLAYESWGIDVDELERRRNKLIKLGLRK